MQPLEAGEPHTIGAYRLLGRLGAGGMGRVYLGRSAGGRTVAVKVVHPHFALDEQFRARFRREVEAARRLGAQWTAPVLDADPDAAVPWVATGYVAGPPLSEAVPRYGPLPEYAVRTLGAGLAEALDAVHGHGLVHRDVKPSNVLLALDGPRLIDFGIARATGATVSLTSTGVSVGSPGYMAPEQIRGLDISGAADVFSLGAVLAYAATGDAPFPGRLLGRAALQGRARGARTRRPGGRAAGAGRRRASPRTPPTGPPPPSSPAGSHPAGPPRCVAPGWLPGPLVRAGQPAAVDLLDLEPQDGAACSRGRCRSAPRPGQARRSASSARPCRPGRPDRPPRGRIPAARTPRGAAAPAARLAVTMGTGPQSGARRRPAGQLHPRAGRRRRARRGDRGRRDAGRPVPRQRRERHGNDAAQPPSATGRRRPSDAARRPRGGASRHGAARCPRPSSAPGRAPPPSAPGAARHASPPCSRRGRRARTSPAGPRARRARDERRLQGHRHARLRHGHRAEDPRAHRPGPRHRLPVHRRRGRPRLHPHRGRTPCATSPTRRRRATPKGTLTRSGG